jgi:hypothetical protein
LDASTAGEVGSGWNPDQGIRPPTASRRVTSDHVRVCAHKRQVVARRVGAADDVGDAVERRILDAEAFPERIEAATRAVMREVDSVLLMS